MIGSLLGGRYRIVRVLGTGGFKQTYLAEDVLLPSSPLRVVEQIKLQITSDDTLPRARHYFNQEAETLERLSHHDQIPRLFAYFEQDGEFYLVQEFIEGHSLSQEFSSTSRLSEAEAIVLLQQVLGILEFVHENHVIHRDIKPSNLIRRHRDGKVVLLNFGAVKQTLMEPTAKMGRLSVVIGTLGFMPPEQQTGIPCYSSDLYALGLTVIQGVMGLHPSQLPTDPETGELLWQDHTSISPELQRILERMVRYQFRERYQSAREVLKALDQLSVHDSTPTFIARSSVPSEALMSESTIRYRVSRKYRDSTAQSAHINFTIRHKILRFIGYAFLGLCLAWVIQQAALSVGAGIVLSSLAVIAILCAEPAFQAVRYLFQKVLEFIDCILERLAELILSSRLFSKPPPLQTSTDNQFAAFQRIRANDETVFGLLEELGDRRIEVRLQAIHALEQVNLDVAIPALCKTLREDKSPEVRRSAAEALGRIAGQKTG